MPHTAPTILLNGETWYVISSNPLGVTVRRESKVRFVSHEDVR